VRSTLELPDGALAEMTSIDPAFIPCRTRPMKPEGVGLRIGNTHAVGGGEQTISGSWLNFNHDEQAGVGRGGRPIG